MVTCLAVAELDLAKGDRGGGHVKDEAVAAVSGCGQCERIGAEAPRRGPGRVGQRRRVAAAQRDQPVLQRLHRVVACDAVVVGPLGNDHADPERLRLACSGGAFCSRDA